VEGLYEQIQEASGFIRSKTRTVPRYALILGTGLGGMAESIKADVAIAYDEIPHFAKSTSIGHVGNLIIGELGGKSVVAMQGRIHYYEGYSAKEIVLPVLVMEMLGIKTLIVSNVIFFCSSSINRFAFSPI